MKAFFPNARVRASVAPCQCADLSPGLAMRFSRLLFAVAGLLHPIVGSDTACVTEQHAAERKEQFGSYGHHFDCSLINRVQPGLGPLYVAVLIDKSGSNTLMEAFTFRARDRGWPKISACCQGTVKELTELCKIPLIGPDCRFSPDHAVVLDQRFGFCEEVVHGSRPCRYILLLRDPIDRLISSYNFFCVACQEDGRECRQAGLDNPNCNQAGLDNPKCRPSDLDCPRVSLIEYALAKGSYYANTIGPRSSPNRRQARASVDGAVRAITKLLESDAIAFVSTLENLGSQATALTSLLSPANSLSSPPSTWARSLHLILNSQAETWDHPDRRADLSPLAQARARVRTKASLNRTELRLLRDILAPDYDLYHRVGRLEIRNSN